MNLYITFSIIWAVFCSALPQNNANSSYAGNTIYETSTCTCDGAIGTTSDAKKDTPVTRSGTTASTTEISTTSPTINVPSASDVTFMLQKGLEESDMYLADGPEVSNDGDSQGTLYCGIHVADSKTSSTSIPRCLAEVFILDFCDFKHSKTVGRDYPLAASEKGGYWTTYTYRGFNHSGVYIGFEIDRINESYKSHKHKFKEGRDEQCVKTLREGILDSCRHLLMFLPDSTKVIDADTGDR